MKHPTIKDILVKTSAIMAKVPYRGRSRVFTDKQRAALLTLWLSARNLGEEKTWLEFSAISFDVMYRWVKKLGSPAQQAQIRSFKRNASGRKVTDPQPETEAPADSRSFIDIIDDVTSQLKEVRAEIQTDVAAATKPGFFHRIWSFITGQ